MAGLGAEDTFLAALLDAPMQPVKRKSTTDAAGPSKRQALRAPSPPPAPPSQMAPQSIPQETAARTPRKEKHRGSTSKAQPKGKGKSPTQKKQRPPTPAASETDSLRPFIDSMRPNMETAIAAALNAPMPSEVFDVVLNSRDYLAKLTAALNILSATLANVSGVPLSEFRDYLADSSSNADVTKRDHQAEIQRLRSDLERQMKELRGRVTSLEAEVAERDRQLRAKDEHVAKVEAAAEKRVAALTEERGELSRRLSDLRKEAECLQGQVSTLQSKINKYTEFLVEEVPKAKRRSYRECLEKVLKKIRHAYPDADLAYFAADSQSADVDIDPALLAEYADVPPAASEETLEQEIEDDGADNPAKTAA